ncbi:hypothetical protein D3C72_2044590 [compost metagenome]
MASPPTTITVSNTRSPNASVPTLRPPEARKVDPSSDSTRTSYKASPALKLAYSNTGMAASAMDWKPSKTTNATLIIAWSSEHHVRKT